MYFENTYNVPMVEGVTYTLQVNFYNASGANLGAIFIHNGIPILPIPITPGKIYITSSITEARFSVSGFEQGKGSLVSNESKLIVEDTGTGTIYEAIDTNFDDGISFNISGLEPNAQYQAVVEYYKLDGTTSPDYKTPPRTFYTAVDVDIIDYEVSPTHSGIHFETLVTFPEEIEQMT
jgi:hypothetical protein